MRLRFVLPAALAIAASTLAAHADTVTFSYATDTPSGGSNSQGSGSFTYTGPLTSIGLNDLTGFSFDLVVNNGGLSFSFDQTDLTEFSATVTDGSISALTLQTTFVSGPVGTGALPEDFTVSGLGTDQAQNDSNTVLRSPRVDIGAVTTDGPGLPPSAATPEPSSLALLGTGIFALAGVARRRMSRS